MTVNEICQMFSGRELRFRDLTLEIIAAMNAEEIDDLAAACTGGFMVAGDPRGWDGFDDMPDEAKSILVSGYENWPGSEETQRRIDLEKLAGIPIDPTLVIPKGAPIH